MDITQVQSALARAESQSRGAAVIIPLLPDSQGLSVLLEVRAATLAVQPGEVCLPGGRIEAGESPLDAAIRETCEELLVEPHQLEVIGSLESMEGPGSRPLHVFVATLAGYEGSFSSAEVDRTFSLPLDWLIEHDPATYRIDYDPRFPVDFPWELVPGGRSYPWRTRTHDVPFYEGTEPVLWGATARVLRRFADLLRASQIPSSRREEAPVIRLADASDLAAVIALYHEVSDAMIGTPYDCCWRRGGHPSDELVTRLVRDGGMLVVMDDGELVGAAGIDHDLGHDYGPLPWLVDVPEDEADVIHLLTVLPSHRGKGLSRLLLHACMDESRRRGMRSVRLDVTDNNEPARLLYQSEGFAFIGAGVQEIGPDDRPLVRLEVMEYVL